MFKPYRLKSPLGRDYNVDLDDSLRTKKTFKDLGYYKTPSYGMTPYPDEPLFGAIESFQKDQGLRRDGVMKPDGETATTLGQEIRDRKKGYGTHRLDTSEPRSLFGLSDELGKRRRNKTQDVMATRQALERTGHFPKAKSKTDIRKPSDSLFDAIKSFQRKSGLKVDGWMRPYGETERALDRTLSRKVDEEKSRDGKKGDDQKEVAFGPIPAIVYKIAEYFGMALLAAMAWWQSMSPAERNKVRRHVQGSGNSSDNRENDECDDQLEADLRRCSQIAKGNREIYRRCQKSAMERYANCIAGRPLGPLDEGH